MALLEAQTLSKRFAVRRGLFRRTVAAVSAVDGVNLALEPGECFALVGESGSGKTTLGRCLLRLIEPSDGRVTFEGRDLAELSPRDLRRLRRRFQMIFQDPYGSLNPRMTIEKTLLEPLEVHAIGTAVERRERVARLLEMTGLPAGALTRYPHEFSGGQRQRIGIARAIATEPDLLVADEPVSALDVSVQAQIVNLLADLRRDLGVALLFIAHDLAVVRQIADRIGVLYLGRIVEQGAAAEVFSRPLHPYTVGLLASVPRPDPSRQRHTALPGETPDATDPPSGCAFHPRCPIADERCRRETPELVEHLPGRWAACHRPGELQSLDEAVGGESTAR